MKIFPHKKFQKQFKKLKEGEQKQFHTRMEVFLDDPFNKILNNHQLHGKFSDCRSINITGNLRIIYQEGNDNIVYFLEIGSHSELYS